MQNFDPYDALVPVFLRTQAPNRVAQLGTAVFVELHGEPFLYTAAHVTDDHKTGELLVPTATGLEPIDGYMAFIDLPPEVRRGTDRIDIAYYRLSSKFATDLCGHFRPVPQTRCELIKSSLELTVCSVSGYPATKSGKTADGAHRSEIFSFRGVAAQQHVYDSLELSSDLNIVIHFNKKQAVDPEKFEKTSTPSLKGISGGGIFAWPKGEELSDDWNLPKLVGLMHCFRERDGLIIGTTLLPVLAAVQLGKMKRFGGIR
ncbi:hypothetical protein [Limnobacter sp.]|uniref:hypothetical protein n=1 Tax=Limnobacter sp. TaxID=2003368 RepID=UPI003BAC4E8C